LKAARKTIREMTDEEIFSEISKRQISALMFHDQMADMCEFLNLTGFRCWHEKQYIEESKEMQKTKRYFMSTHNKLIFIDDVEQPQELIPDSWYSYTRLDVDAQILRQHTESGLMAYKIWEETSKRLYEQCAKALLEMGNVCDYAYVEKLIEDVNVELDQIYQRIAKFKSVDYDMTYIMEMQDKLSRKCK